MKKKLKIFAIILLSLLLILIALPFVFKEKLVELVKQTANNNINATLDFKDAHLSLLSAFPNIKLNLEDLYIVNKEPFAGDTLFMAKTIDINLPFQALFSSDAVQVNSFHIENAALNMLVNANGVANYDIAKKSEPSTGNSTDDGFQFNLNTYEIKNSTVRYHADKVYLGITHFNHSGSGNLSTDESVLKTKSNATVSFAYDSINYLNNHSVALDADVKLNLKDMVYTFLENEAKINELPLVFNGFVDVNDTNQEIDITFKTPSSDFKNFLAIIPKEYSKNIENVQTTGNFDVQGKIKGVVDDTHIPTLDISIASNDASFKYPDLPKSLDNIQINTKIVNTTGLVKDTYVDVDKLSFTIDQDPFNAQAKITAITENMKVNASLNGNLNLAKLEKIHPAEALKGLQGLLNADVSMAFDMHAIEQKKYEDTKVSGTAAIQNFKYASAALKHPLQIDKTSLAFNPKTVSVKEFDAKIGQTDMKINGTLTNFLGFLFNKEHIEGNFNLASNNFVVNDFMSSTTTDQKKDTTTATSKEQLKFPAFLDATLNAKAKTVVYDNITLKNVSGNLRIKDQTASLNNMTSDVFGGQLGFNGLVSTKSETPKFEMTLDAKNFNIGESFTSLELFQSLAPIANAIQGKITTDISLSGMLNNDFTPNLNTLSGKVFAELLESKLGKENAPLLQKLTQNLSFFDAKKLNLDDLKASLSFKDGKVAVKPFTLTYEDIEIAVGGGHGFDKSVDYDVVFNVPAKYLGKEAEKLLAQLTDEEQNTIRVPVTAFVNGNFSSPSITTDLKAAVASLTKQVANNQKDKLVNKGKEQLDNALDKLLNKNKDTLHVATDSTATKKPDAVKETAKDLIKGIFGKKKKPEEQKDTVN